MKIQEAIDEVQNFVSYCDEQLSEAQKQKRHYSIAINVLDAVYNDQESYDNQDFNFSLTAIDTVISELEEYISYFNSEIENAKRLKENYSMAVFALKKQIPKKPAKDEYEHNCCPTCGYAGIYKDEWGGRYIPHCENCGQAIDWEEVVS